METLHLALAEAQLVVEQSSVVIASSADASVVASVETGHLATVAEHSVDKMVDTYPAEIAVGFVIAAELHHTAVAGFAPEQANFVAGPFA